MDRKTVMSWLEGLAQSDWREFHNDSEVQNIASEALSLLKEDCHNCKLECLLQKYDQLKEKYDKLLKEYGAVEPKTEPSAKGYWYTCGACGWWLFEVRDTVHFDGRKRIRFCASCGRLVKWNEID